MYIISFVYICVYHCISHISEHVLHYISMQGAYNHHQKHHFFVAGDPPGSPSHRLSAPRTSRFEAARPGCAIWGVRVSFLLGPHEVWSKRWLNCLTKWKWKFHIPTKISIVSGEIVGLGYTNGPWMGATRCLDHIAPSSHRSNTFQQWFRLGGIQC